MIKFPIGYSLLVDTVCVYTVGFNSTVLEFSMHVHFVQVKNYSFLFLTITETLDIIWIFMCPVFGDYFILYFGMLLKVFQILEYYESNIQTSKFFIARKFVIMYRISKVSDLPKKFFNKF